MDRTRIGNGYSLVNRLSGNLDITTVDGELTIEFERGSDSVEPLTLDLISYSSPEGVLRLLERLAEMHGWNMDFREMVAALERGYSSSKTVDFDE